MNKYLISFLLSIGSTYAMDNLLISEHSSSNEHADESINKILQRLVVLSDIHQTLERIGAFSNNNHCMQKTSTAYVSTIETHLSCLRGSPLYFERPCVCVKKYQELASRKKELVSIFAQYKDTLKEATKFFNNSYEIVLIDDPIIEERLILLKNTVDILHTNGKTLTALFESLTHDVNQFRTNLSIYAAATVVSAGSYILYLFSFQ